MNNIKTYLSNLTKVDIENATKEQLALIIDYMEQVKGDVSFSALIKDKVEQFKQFATEANNKIILEAALQEQQEKQELLRERVRFVRNLDYIDKTVHVQHTREEDSRIQRNIERQQRNIQSYLAAIERQEQNIAEANINETIQKRKELQAKIATYKEDEVPAHLKSQLNNLIYTEVTVGVTNHILAKQKDDENLKGYQIKISSFGSDMGVISLKSKDGEQVMLDFTEAMLKVGLKNLTSENKTDINSIDDFLKDFTNTNTKFTLVNEEGNETKFNSINEQYAKLRALVSYKLENKDNADLTDMLKEHINAMRKTLISAYVNDPHLKMNREEAERFINRMTEDEIMANNVYSAYNNVYKKEEVNQLTPAYSLGIVLQKMKNKEPVSEEEKQFALDELSKQGKPLGEIKEEYPQLDRLVAKEHEAVALGNVNEQTKEQVAEKILNEEDIGVRI